MIRVSVDGKGVVIIVMAVVMEWFAWKMITII